MTLQQVLDTLEGSPPAPSSVPVKRGDNLTTFSDRDKLIAWAASQILLPSDAEADIPPQLKGLLQELSKDDPGFTLKFAVSLKIPLKLVWPRFALWLCSDFLQPFLSITSKAAVEVVVGLHREWLQGTNPVESQWREAADSIRGAVYAATAATAAAYAAADAAAATAAATATAAAYATAATAVADAAAATAAAAAATVATAAAYAAAAADAAAAAAADAAAATAATVAAYAAAKSKARHKFRQFLLTLGDPPPNE
jgi:hypothetical protein